MDKGEPDEAGEDQERDAQEEEELGGWSVLLLEALEVDVLEYDTPAAMGTVKEHFLQGLTRGRKARCQSLEVE